ncbi:hypothetical protein [Microcella frigidaquae]|uniref:Uncharacterized protein n=1 Tax=Microcella frigidaquae TaxID=424758 RepID=A0A840XJJ8_9MICO|nr:hypothetical protein [Microcella frigidaquae]MBB5617027.1 hypothetical protein [Microcella frigidaquae]NHN45232.1 hypothetical protein [Microcella frigidaquae]
MMRATTEDGRQVVLFPTGEWVWEDESRVATPSVPSLFRSVPWGVSKDEVQRREVREPLTADSGSDELHFEVRFFGQRWLARYSFFKNTLEKGELLLVDELPDEDANVELFQRIKVACEAQFGEGQEKQIWSNDLFEDDPESWGLAVGLGHMTWHAVFRSSDSRIEILLNEGDGVDMALFVKYSPAVQSI